eukprot:332672_1
MVMKQCLDIRIILLIVSKIKRGKHKDIWENILNRWGLVNLELFCDHIQESWPDKVVIKTEVFKAYNKFKQKIKLITINGQLDELHKRFKRYWRRQTNYKGQWTIENECERLFFKRKELFDGVQPFLRVYDIGANLDCIEAKMETVGKDIKYFLTVKGNLDQTQLKWELVLKDNLNKVGYEEKFIEKLTKLFLQFKKNVSPQVPNRKTIISQVVDRYLHEKEKFQMQEDDVVELMCALFKKELNI